MAQYNPSQKFNKYINVLDYSLDLPKLREVYLKVYRNAQFSFFENTKEYCPHVLNVTFKYNDKLFNRKKLGCYIRSGYTVDDNEFEDCVCFKDGLLVGVKTGIEVASPLSKEELENSFVVKDGKYEAKNNIPILNSVSDLRNKLYEDGFVMNGKKYVRFKRSSGSSRVGKCLFIDERLYPRMHKWEMCGIKVNPDDPIDLAALEAYIALTLSSIIGTLTIQPEEILVIDDFESTFQDKVVVTDVENGKLRSYPDEIAITNSIWDGQSLIDASLIDHGMALLRNRFFKSCCFNTNIQQFFADQGITEVSQLNGRTRATELSQIKLITTPSSIKYLKFGTLDQWLDNLEPTFGIVKHEKKTHFFDGELVQTHYQLINTLQMTQKEMDEFLKPTVDYVKALRFQPEVLRNHIKYPAEYEGTSANCKNDIVFNLMGVNSKFCQTKIYYDFMRELIRAYVKNVRRGRVLVHGNYSTLFGNPYEMLLQSIGRFDGTSHLGIGNICTKNFAYNKTLLGSRSPHVCMGNIWLPYNVDNEDIERYFNLSTEIVCLNSINENVLQRLSGCDFDSDTVMLTDNEILIAAAEKNYEAFLVPTSAVEAKKTKRLYTNAEKADLDIRTSDNKIGEIINLAQRLNTLFWDRVNNGQSFEENMDLYCDVAKLDVMSGIEIDKAKKEFVVNVGSEINAIKQKYFPKESGEKTVKPNFFGLISRMKGYYNGDKNAYVFHDTSMDYLQHTMNRLKLPKMEEWEGCDFSVLLASLPYDSTKVNYHQIETLQKKVEDFNMFSRLLWMKSNEEISPELKHELRLESEAALIDYISKCKMHQDTVICLLRRIDEDGANNMKRQILTLLFSTGNESFYDLIRSHREPLPYLIQDELGNVDFYGVKFRVEAGN